MTSRKVHINLNALRTLGLFTHCLQTIVGAEATGALSFIRQSLLNYLIVMIFVFVGSGNHRLQWFDCIHDCSASFVVFRLYVWGLCVAQSRIFYIVYLGCLE